MTKRVLCTGAGGPAGINFVKSLTVAPEKLYIVGTEASEYYLHTMPIDTKYLVPKAKDPSYIDRLNEIIRKEKIDFFHAQPDVEVEVVSEQREKLEAPVFLPSKQAVKACQDKLESATAWKNKGIPVAKTIVIKQESDIDRAFAELGSPIWIRATRGAGGRGSTPASNRETAVSWINYWRARNVEWDYCSRNVARQKHCIPQPVAQWRARHFNGARTHRVHLFLLGAFRNYGHPCSAKNSA